jgi:hypothetical protein
MFDDFNLPFMRYENIHDGHRIFSQMVAYLLGASCFLRVRQFEAVLSQGVALARIQPPTTSP